MARELEHFSSLVAMFFARAAERGDAPFLHARRGGRWEALSWAEVAGRVSRLAAALGRLGLAPGDRVVLVSENRPEWLIADLAIMAAGGVTVPAYTTNTAADHAHVLGDSGATLAIVSTAKLAAPLLATAGELGTVRGLVTMEPLATPAPDGLAIHDWSALLAGEPVAAPAAAFRRDDLACIIYTSGTGGRPRGVRQHHGAILHNVEGAARIIAEDFGWGEEVFLSFLPLSHALEHTGGQFLPIGLGAQIFYAEGLERLAANIAEARPTIMIVVPRLFEMLRGKIVQAAEKQGGIGLTLLRRALAGGARQAAGRRTLLDRLLDPVLDRTVRARVRGRFGGRVKALVSGGAPLDPEVGIFFEALGLTLLQGYGQTEAAPIISCNRPSAGIAMASVGPPLANTEVRIAADGEIEVRGELVMRGYWNNPDETARVLRDGWLATGDVGHLDERGRLVITDRKKDLIVNDKGDNISPQRVEARLTARAEIAQAMVVGDRRPHLVALLVPDAEWAAHWACANRLPLNFAALAHEPGFMRALGAAVDAINAELGVTEKVRRFALADEPFAVANGELTPSMKIRRHVLRARYGERLDALYRLPR